MFESLQHSDQCFVTLTYSADVGPLSAHLRPADAVSWLKRLRKAVSPVRLRYFLVGEYGEKSLRPHFHVLLFGLPLSASSEKLIQETWGRGFVHLGEVNQHTIAYTVGYVLKKQLVNQRKAGLVPEFARMSLKPGIGAGFASQAASSLNQPHIAPVALSDGIPTQVRYQGKKLPLGRYLRQKIADASGRELVSEEAKLAYLERLWDLCESKKTTSFVEAVEDSQGCLNREKRFDLFNSRRSL